MSSRRSRHQRICLFVLLACAGICVYGSGPIARRAYSKSPFEACPRMTSLAKNYQIIAKEAASLPENIIDGPVQARVQADWVGDKALLNVHEQFTTKSGWVYGWQAGEEGPNLKWKNWGIIFDGKVCGENARACPRTTHFLSSIPGIRVAGFSLMMPRSTIHPHTDATGRKFSSMAYHLGLDCPPGCRLFVGQDSIQEKSGRDFCFDATFVHWAENKSNQPRMILYIDFAI